MDFKFHTLFLSLFSVAAAAVFPPGERIINGASIDIEQAPWQISLLVNSKHNCGGSILSERIILTAAHCLDGWIPKELTVRAGSRYAERGGQLRLVKDFKIDAFNIEGLRHDIGIILLDKPLKFDPKVQPIELAKENPKNGETVSVSGWGLINISGIFKYPKDLQGVNVHIVDRKACIVFESLWSDDWICASGPGTGSGDSGGPLVLNRVQVGIASRSNFVQSGVYTNVAHYYNWIQDTIKELENRN